MLFAEFAQLLHPYFKHIPKRKGIVNYTRSLLEHCFLEGKCGTITDSTAKRFYYGKREKGSNALIGDEIGCFAKNMICLFDANRLAEYIKECTSVIATKEDLCNAFNMIPGLNADNYPTKLAEYLQTVMQKAAENYESEKSKKAAPIISETDRNNITRTILELYELVDELIEWSLLNHEQFFSVYYDIKMPVTVKCEENNPGIVEKVFGPDPPQLPYESAQKFQKLQLNNRKLKFYCERYADFTLLSELHQEGNNLKSSDFFPTPNCSDNKPYSERVDHYRALLAKCNKTLANW